jgi:serpin B
MKINFIPIRWPLFLFLAAILLSIALVGCGNGTDEQNETGEMMRMSGKPRGIPMTRDDARVDQLVRDNGDFAFDLYAGLFDSQNNMVFSPQSLSSALAMAYAGARNQTEEQMASVLNFKLGQSQLHPAFNALDQALRSREFAKLKLSNALWGSQEGDYEELFLEILAENYGAGIRVVDFGQPEAARQLINQWVSDETDNRIADLLPAGSIRENTDLVLTNGAYFQAAWVNPFDQAITQPGGFTGLDGLQIEVPMMSQVAELGYADVSGVKVVELPYEGEEWSMVILVPEIDSFEPFATNLGFEIIESILENIEPAVVQLSLPKFEFNTTYQLKPTLMKMGLTDAFGDADFSGIDGTLELFIDDIFHQGFLSVDEAGTEASAASAIVMSRKGIPNVEVTLQVDRPFIFLIHDLETGAILFLGHVVNPMGTVGTPGSLN